MMELDFNALMLAGFGVVMLIDTLMGLRLYRRAETLAAGPNANPDGVRRVGLIMMVGGPLFFVTMAVLIATGLVDFSGGAG